MDKVYLSFKANDCDFTGEYSTFSYFYKGKLFFDVFNKPLKIKIKEPKIILTSPLTCELYDISDIEVDLSLFTEEARKRFGEKGLKSILIEYLENLEFDRKCIYALDGNIAIEYNAILTPTNKRTIIKHSNYSFDSCGVQTKIENSTELFKIIKAERVFYPKQQGQLMLDL